MEISNVKRKKIGFKLGAQHRHHAVVFQLGNLEMATRLCGGPGRGRLLLLAKSRRCYCVKEGIKRVKFSNKKRS